MRVILLLILFSTSSLCFSAPDTIGLKIWYDRPAEKWMESIPVGNGRLGAMIFGGTDVDRVALNEITMWAGQPDPAQEVPCGKEKLAEIRKLFFDGRLKEGNDLAIKYLSGKPNTFGTHLPVGDLYIQSDHGRQEITGYRRELDLKNGLATVTYSQDGVKYRREYFCSNPDNVLVIRMTADREHSVDCSVSLSIPGESKVLVSKDQIMFSGSASSTLKVKGFPDFSKGGVRFAGIVSINAPGGIIRQTGSGMIIKEADELVIVTDIRTDFHNPSFSGLCAKTTTDAASKTYDDLKRSHIRDYSSFFSRFEISLGQGETDSLPTDRRLRKYNSGAVDPGLCALFLQYNRYLLISCSRENSPLPANLQGLWNDNLAANMPWTCDYHLDINTQQNYWAANVTNLAECNAPLFSYVKYLSEAGEKTAAKVYGSPGWVAHTVTNVWGYTAPGEWPGWGLFPTAGTWIALHLWEHFLFTRDTIFLRNTAYPILKKNALFFLDYMVRDPVSGYLMTGPSTSPENSFRYKGDVLSLSMMPTCDRVFVQELFSSCISASEMLGTDPDFRSQLENAAGKLPPFRISKTGELQEWFSDYEKAIPNHRHTTHLTSLYPFSQISLMRTPELAAAAAKTIQYRLDSPGWEDVEWSRANMINFFARLKEPEQAMKSIHILLRDLTRENLLTVSVAGIAGASLDIFVLDGNEAAASGMAEMLIQSHEDYIEFLPSLPKEWKTGSYRGLCVRGGATADAEWENMKIRKASVRAGVSNTFRIKIPDPAHAKLSLNGKRISSAGLTGDILKADLGKGDVLSIEY